MYSLTGLKILSFGQLTVKLRKLCWLKTQVL
jgi:hypothetical protein